MPKIYNSENERIEARKNSYRKYRMSEKGKLANKKGRTKYLNDPLNKKKMLAYQAKYQQKQKKDIVNDFLKGNRYGFWTYKIYNLRKAPKQRNINLNLSKEDLEKQWLNQSGRCYFSKIKLIPLIDNNKRDRNRFSSINAIGIDRIDSSKGYVKGNIIFVSLKVNVMKGSSTKKEFINICKLIYNNSLK